MMLCPPPCGMFSYSIGSPAGMSKTSLLWGTRGWAQELTRAGQLPPCSPCRDIDELNGSEQRASKAFRIRHDKLSVRSFVKWIPVVVVYVATSILIRRSSDALDAKAPASVEERRPHRRSGHNLFLGTSSRKGGQRKLYLPLFGRGDHA